MAFVEDRSAFFADFGVDGTLAQILELLYDRSAEVVMLQQGIAGLSQPADATPG